MSVKNSVKIGNVVIGGGNPVAVQSMTNTDTADYDKTAESIRKLIKARCDIIRLAVRDERDIEVCKRYVKNFDVPLVADIQFDYRLAVASADIGFAKVRYNPGNTSQSGLQEVVTACKKNGCPIRIGINGGSLEKDILAKYGEVTAEALSESALRSVRLLEKQGFYDIVISVKSSSVKTSVLAYNLLDKACAYPLHIGITESGQAESAIIKSTAGIASLLLSGIGDTVRVSLTGEPVREVEVAHHILRALEMEKDFVDVVSCPTCARCFYDLESLVIKVKQMTENVRKSLKVAVMGCVVNGPGEASDADIGIAGGKDKAVLFKKGQVIETLPIDQAENKFLSMLGDLIE